MRTPRTEDLPPEPREAARAVARTLQGAGHRAWLVGGAVRDLCLGRPVKDVDLVSGARPEEVLALFPRTNEVGASFGIVVVRTGDLEVEVATFREERGYSDARRPDLVTYADTPEVDARRRDFTCNALYLDPLDDTLVDPAGGLDDLRAGRLATVGEAADRFREDGLRLVRMARFEAALDLAPAPGLHEAAARERDALRGVSAERVLDELGKILRGPRAARAVATLDACGLAERVLPGWADVEAAERARRIEVLGGHDPVAGPGTGVEAGLAALLRASDAAALRDLVGALRPSRDLQRAVLELARLEDELPVLARTDAARSARLRALRSPWFAAALDLARRRARAEGRAVDAAALEGLAAWAEDAGDPSPALLVTTDELRAAGVAPGPRFGELLREAEDAQLDGVFEDAEGAAGWLRERLASRDTE